MDWIKNRNKNENLYKTMYTIIMLIIKSGYWNEIYPDFDKQFGYSSNGYDIFMYFNDVDDKSKTILRKMMNISVEYPDIHAYEYMLSVISNWDDLYGKTSSFFLNSEIIRDELYAIKMNSETRGYMKKSEKEFIQKYVKNNLILFDGFNAEFAS